MDNSQSEVNDPDLASHLKAAAVSSVEARQQIQHRMSALELGKRSMHGPFVYVISALIAILGSSIRSDFPLLAILVVASLSLLAVLRVLYARGFESRYDRVGERAVRDFTILLPIQCSIFSWSAGAVVIHYGEEVESILALLFGISAAAAGTSSLAPRVRVHRVFLAALMTPLLASLIPGFGDLGVGLLIGSLVMVAFYLREVVLASAAYSGLVETQLDLEAAAEHIESLRGIIPICAWCKDIRDDDGFWEDVETYVRGRSKAEFTHSICPKCRLVHFPQTAMASKGTE